MIRKLIRALVVTSAATAGAVILLRMLEKRESSRPVLGSAEVDADRLDEKHRSALVAELEAQL